MLVVVVLYLFSIEPTKISGSAIIILQDVACSLLLGLLCACLPLLFKGLCNGLNVSLGSAVLWDIEVDLR